MNIRRVLVQGSLRILVQTLMSHEQARRYVFEQVEKTMREEATETARGGPLSQVQRDRLDCVSALLHGFDRSMRRGLVSKRVMRTILEALLGNILLNERSAECADELGFEPPSFVTISPTGACNLRCKGCYASDAALRGNQLDLLTFDRILREKRRLWGSHFTVISGGEPFLWKDGDCDLIELAKRHPEDVFMVYTNGTLLNQELVDRILDAGNISPSISVEGFADETEARRGRGTYGRILEAFANLRSAGIPFGVSATATRDNWEVITSERFADFYFEEQGALYGWIFQYMPIGRGQSMDMVVPPEARVKMVDRMWRLVREWKVFLADFWNSGTASYGCISAGRGSGYFYINWDGDIMPCVFTPYASDNIHDLYARGDDLNAALDSAFFRRIRQWQRDYGYEKPLSETDNWLCPCAIRDHFDDFLSSVIETGARPINAEAREALEDAAYKERMLAYGRQIKELTDDRWRNCYQYRCAPAEGGGNGKRAPSDPAMRGSR